MKLLIFLLLLGCAEKVPKKVIIKNRVFVCSKNWEVVNTTYHKYLMIDNGKDLIHLGSCYNKTHKKL